jgi:hypothetical protein
LSRSGVAAASSSGVGEGDERRWDHPATRSTATNRRLGVRTRLFAT